MWGRVVNYKECQEKCRSAIKRWQIAEAKTAYSSLADRNYPTRALTARAVPKEQSGGDGSVQRELCVFVPDACNTFPLPIGDFTCVPLVEDSSCDCSAPAAASTQPRVPAC